MTELTVGLTIAVFALGFLAGMFVAQRSLAAERARLARDIEAVRQLRIRLRGRG